MLILSLIAVMMLKHYHKDKEFPCDFDENLSFQKWMWILAGTVGSFILMSFFGSISMPSGQFDPTIFVPTIFFLGITQQFPTYVNDMLFNIALVAPAEELTKLTCMVGLYLFLGQYTRDKKIKLGISVGLPVFFWAVLHVYKNPAYIGNYWHVVGAFSSGLLFMLVLWKTKSVLAAILAHGLYNCLVIFLVSQGFLVVPVT